MRNFKIKLLFVLFIIGHSSCEKEFVDFDSFEPVLENDLYEYLNPDINYDYFEIRYSLCGDMDYESLFSKGNKCLNSTDVNKCILDLDTLITESGGFHIECRPACCGYYIISQVSNSNQIFETPDGVKLFLGNIDSNSDALFLAFSQGYNFKNNSKEVSAIKESENGYQMISTKIVNYCNPVQIDRFLLEINQNGNIKILKQELLSKEDGLCI